MSVCNTLAPLPTKITKCYRIEICLLIKKLIKKKLNENHDAKGSLFRVYFWTFLSIYKKLISS